MSHVPPSLAAPERSLEEVVRQGPALRVLRERQVARVVVAHREPLGIGPGDELVVLPTVDLHLVLVVAVHQVPRRLVERDVLVDAERLVREVAVEAVIRDVAHVRGQRRRRQLRVDLGQALHDLPGEVDLHRVCRVRLREPVGSGEAAVQVVERVVLQIEHHEVIDVLERRRLCRRARRGKRHARDDGREDEQETSHM
jgi:hypothetical protein